MDLKALSIVVCLAGLPCVGRAVSAQPLDPSPSQSGPRTLANLLGESSDGNRPIPMTMPETPAKRMPEPPPADVREALALVKEACADLYREADEKPRELVQELLRFASGTEDAPRLYALLQEAERIARKSNSVDLVVITAVERGKRFEVDSFKEILESLRGLNINLENGKDIFGISMAVARDALKAEDFATSEEACTAAKSAASAFEKAEKAYAKELRRKSRGMAPLPAPKAPELLQIAERFEEEIRARQTAFRQYEIGQEQIANGPESGGAHRVVGTYLCLFRGGWAEGLPFLVNCDHSGLQDAARRDLAAGSNPGPEDGFQIAGLWWTLASDARLTEREKELARTRAQSLYTEALPRLLDPIEKRVAKQRSANAD